MASNKSIENREWISSLEWVIENESPARAEELLELLQKTARQLGVKAPSAEKLISEYLNSIAADEEEQYPGNEEMERKIYSAIRWNAMAMVVRANQKNDGIGGHISTYSSISTLWEVGFNHFFYGYDADGGPDLIYFQGHASPGLYGRSFLEHRFEEENLENFRLEIQSEKGLSSYPHPRLMPEYWRFPTVSMGLAPLQAIYQARFLKYLKNRGLIDEKARQQQVYAFLGDGEMDEPESTGALAVATREKLDNLTFIVNCNLQRLDGPVRGNNQVVAELEGIFRGAGWEVIKVIWGRGWDKVFERDTEGKVAARFAEMNDGQMQHLPNYSAADWREKFFTGDLAELVEDFEDSDFNELKRGGHDNQKVYNAYKKALETEGKASVILAQTVKGYQQGKGAGEASNVTHQTKKMKTEAVQEFSKKLNLPLEDEELEKLPFYRFEKDSDEFKYLKERREKLGGWLPERRVLGDDFKMPDPKVFQEFDKGSGDDEVPTTGVFVKILTKLLRDKNLKGKVVPIVPDESRTFGMDPLFRQVGIYAAQGQKYQPVDKDSMLFYKEAQDGAILEEGITEAGSMASFIAAGTNHISQPFYTIPFFIFYSMFGFQRIGDLVWAASDARARGFMLGGISGRTSLAGEGLQHTDGNSQLFALAYPSVMAYDPAFAYELATIIEKGLERMYKNQEDLIYYITLGNQPMAMPKRPKELEQGILRGLYRFKKSSKRKNKSKKINLLGSGSIMKEVREAAQILEDDFDLPADIWSVTSYKLLYENARDTERTNRLQGKENKCYLQEQLAEAGEIFVAASDWVKALPLSVAKWVPGDFTALGTDGFGRSDTVPAMRKFFEVDAVHIAHAALHALWRKGEVQKEELKKFRKKHNINHKENPADQL